MIRIYKPLLSCIFILFYLQAHTQDKPTIYLSGELSILSKTTKEDAFLTNQKGFNLGAFIPLIKGKATSFGLNFSFSKLNSKSTDFPGAPLGFSIMGFPGRTVNLKDANHIKQSNLKFGIAPQVNFRVGESFILSPFVQIGIQSLKRDSFTYFQEINTSGTLPKSIGIYHQDAISKNSFFLNPGIRISYPIYKGLRIWGAGAYHISKTNIGERRLTPKSSSDNNEYNIDEILGAEHAENHKSVHLSAIGVNLGLSYTIGNVKAKKNQHSQNAQPGGTESKNRKPNLQESGAVMFNNPSKKEHKQQRKLVNVSPKNNTHYENEKAINAFTWKLIGKPINHPNYIIKVNKIGAEGRSLRSYSAQTMNIRISPSAIFKEQRAESGQYQWKVIETSTGISSTPSYFTVSNCEFDHDIKIDSVVCLGYEGENRKFKICFESTYSSSTGDLTYSQSGSGLFVYDQNNSPLSYMLVSPNTSLITQTGSSPSTVNYCFEVTVGSTVNAIGVGLQGDDLNPNPVITCRPGPNVAIDSLPDCYCDECENIELGFDNFSISPKGASGNYYNIQGDFNVNVPIYALEVQVQSYAYTATPASCSDGVADIEQSGMITMPGTKINGSTSLQLFNNSGSPNSNPNITKAIKYTSNSAMTGSIPVNLNIGLPGPLAGLNQDCCSLTYTVCIRVRVFYDQGTCKSCVFTHCFTFNNQ